MNCMTISHWERASYMGISSSPDVKSLDQVTISPTSVHLAKTFSAACPRYCLVQSRTILRNTASLACHSLDHEMRIGNIDVAPALCCSPAFSFSLQMALRSSTSVEGSVVVLRVVCKRLDVITALIVGLEEPFIHVTKTYSPLLPKG